MHGTVSKKYIHIFSLFDSFTEGKLPTPKIKKCLIVLVSWVLEVFCHFTVEAGLTYVSHRI